MAGVGADFTGIVRSDHEEIHLLYYGINKLSNL